MRGATGFVACRPGGRSRAPRTLAAGDSSRERPLCRRPRRVTCGGGPAPRHPAGGCAPPRAGPPEPCAPSAAARRPAWSPARPCSDSLCAPRPAGGGRRRRPEAGERRHGTGASGRGRRADGRGKQGLRLGSPKRDHVDPTAFRTQVSDPSGGRVRGGAWVLGWTAAHCCKRRHRFSSPRGGPRGAPEAAQRGRPPLIPAARQGAPRVWGRLPQ